MVSSGKKYWLGFAFGVALLALFFLTTEWDLLLDTLANANYWYLVPAVLLYQVSVFFRTLRWQSLLSNIRVISIFRLFPVVVIGYMANNLLPLRIGELVRSYYIGERENISKTSALATIVVERLLDALTLLVFIAVVAAFVPLMDLAEGFSKISNVPWPLLATIISVPFALGFMGLVLMASAPIKTAKILKAILRLLPTPAESQLQSLVDLFLNGLESLKSPWSILMLFLLSLPIWIFEAALFFTIGYSFELQHLYTGFFGMAIAMVLITALSNLGSSIPAAPGGIGLFELITREALVLLPLADIDRSVASGYVTIVHAVLLIPMIGLGQLFLLLDNLSLGILGRGGQSFAKSYEDTSTNPLTTKRESGK